MTHSNKKNKKIKITLVLSTHFKQQCPFLGSVFSSHTHNTNHFSESFLRDNTKIKNQSAISELPLIQTGESTWSTNVCEGLSTGSRFMYTADSSGEQHYIYSYYYYVTFWMFPDLYLFTLSPQNIALIINDKWFHIKLNNLNTFWTTNARKQSEINSNCSKLVHLFHMCCTFCSYSSVYQNNYPQ